MPPSVHLQVVPAVTDDADDDAGPRPEPPTAAQLHAHVAGLGVEASCLVDALRSDDVDVDGTDLVALRVGLVDAVQTLVEARRIVERLGHDWILAHGHRGRADIGGVAYRATVTGSGSSLKAADRDRLADTFFRERLAPWLAEQLGEDPDDDGSTARLWLSLVAEKLGEVFSLTPKTTALADRWNLDAGAYVTPTTGLGPAPTFEVAPAPKHAS